MTIFIVTVQGRYIDTFISEEDAKACKQDLYMSGADGIYIESKVLV